MKRLISGGALCLLLGGPASGAEALLELSPEPDGTALRIFGGPKYDWLIESSLDLIGWSSIPGLPPLLANRTNPPTLTLGTDVAAPSLFYRARVTDGLYDLGLLRTIRLTFTNANWAQLLTSGRTTGLNTTALFVMDNGARIEGVGARYRGNTSFTGGPGGSGAPIKKSINLELSYSDPEARLLGYDTLNLNNAYGDETIMREPVYFSVMQRYTVCPKASMVRLYINDVYWGVYSFPQQQNGDLIDEWFPSNDGDRWRAPNMGGGGPGGNANSALGYLGTSVANYQAVYELKTDNSTNAWERLINACQALNQTPDATFRDEVENVLAVDRWLWFLVVENVFADDDSYWNKGADYIFYYEPESGRIHPVEHDGNEAFVTGDASLSPVQGATASNRPVLRRLLSVPELRQRYLAHLRTVLAESFHPAALTPLVDQLAAQAYEATALDTKRGFTMTAYTNDLRAFKTFITNRYTYLTNHAELRPLAPVITAVAAPEPALVAGQTGWITAAVRAGDAASLDSVWLYQRDRSYGRFHVTQMFDDGQHGDGVVGDGVFGAATFAYPADTKVRFYVEARAANASKAASFSPPRAEETTHNFRVRLATASNTPVVINEFMADNTRTIADPQGDFDDWIELRNVTDHEVDLTGRYLTDDPSAPRKWQFPAGTRIPANGFLLIWADEDLEAPFAIHSGFRVAAAGEAIYLLDTDANLNAILDSVVFGAQPVDQSYGRTAANPDVWAVLLPTPSATNK